MNKYDEAIEFLKNIEPGSYFDECASLMEELLAQIHKLETPKKSISRLFNSFITALPKKPVSPKTKTNLFFGYVMCDHH